MPDSCPPSYVNNRAKTQTCDVPALDAAILQLHQRLPSYKATPLVSFPSLAESLGIRSLHIKDESSRLGLPAYKILGASWAIYRAICSKLDLSIGLPLEDVAKHVRDHNISLVCCSAGNWGRAVARMAKYLQIPAIVLVPQGTDEATMQKISNEGAHCYASSGDYDTSIRDAIELADKSSGALLTMDTSWHGYTDFPQWVTDGYSTMLEEISAIVPNPSIVVAPIGVGSFGNAVVVHYKRKGAPGEHQTRIVTVEPDAAAALVTSLHADHIKPIRTRNTIMNGMNCGTISDIAWPFLRDCVDAAVTVTDTEAHEAIIELKSERGIVAEAPNESRNHERPQVATLDPGPCGAATLPALRKVIRENLLKIPLADADIVLFCTEGARDYIVPGLQKD